MVQKKKLINKRVVNIASERFRLQNELDDAILNEKDEDIINELKAKLLECGEAAEEQDLNLNNEKMDIFAKLNSRNRLTNFTEGREAEKAAKQETKMKGATDYDPFARRKTAPKHVTKYYFSDFSNEEDPKSKILAKLASVAHTEKGSGISNLDAVLSQEEDDFLDSIDISALEAGSICNKRRVIMEMNILYSLLFHFTRAFLSRISPHQRRSPEPFFQKIYGRLKRVELSGQIPSRCI